MHLAHRPICGRTIPSAQPFSPLRLLAIVLLFSISLESIALPAPLKAIDPAAAKQTIQKRGIGLGIRVTEVDGTNVRGIITAIHDDTFDVTPVGMTQPTQIPFTQLAAIHNDGNSKAAKVGKGILIGAGIYFLLGIVLVVVVVAVATHTK